MGANIDIKKEHRLLIKELIDKGIAKDDIAKQLGFSVSTVYKEIKRGTVDGKYDPEYSEARYQKNIHDKNKETVIEKMPEVAEYISRCILDDEMSPSEIVRALKKDKRFNGVTFHRETIKRYIRDGLIPGVTGDVLKSDSVKMFSDGLIMIPTWIRKEYDLKDGDTFHIEVNRDQSILLKKQKDIHEIEEQIENLQQANEELKKELPVVGIKDIADSIGISEAKLLHLLEFCKQPRSIGEMRKICDVSSGRIMIEQIVKPLIMSGLLKTQSDEYIEESNKKYVINTDTLIK